MRHAEAYTLERPLPANAEAERFILGAILLDNETIHQAIERLTPGDFFFPSNRTVYEKMLALTEAEIGIDPLTLQEELRRSADLERIGGPAYIASLFDGVPRFSNIENYIRLVKETSRKRRLILFGNAVQGRAIDDELSLDEQCRTAEHELFAINDESAEGHWREISGTACDVLTEAEERAQSGRAVLDFSTGYRDIDFATDGFERQTMVVIAAASKMGKTGLALNLTRKISEAEENRDGEGRPPVIGWFSMEMSRKQQARRLIASMAGVDLRRLRTGQLSRDEWRAVAQAAHQMAGWRVHFDDRAALTPRAMRAAVRRLLRDQGRIDLLFVDYLQLADGEQQRNETRENAVGRVSGALLQIARDYNCCVVALAQLNRENFKRADRRPNAGDLRDSGKILMDAHLVFGLHREEVYDEHTEKKGIAELIILAQREGPMGTIELSCQPDIMRFEDIWRG